MLDLAVVIVAWNNRSVIGDALSSLLSDLAASHLRCQVYVVDSASSDGTPDLVAREFPQVKLIRSGDNIGFGASNNLALRALGFGKAGAASALPKAVYLLNPDTVTHPCATRALYDALESRLNAGVVGARLTYPDGSFQHSAFRFPGLRQIYCEFFSAPGRFLDGRFNGRYPRSLYAGSAPFAVDFALGATMMFKREALITCPGFDEHFFMYCEEVDLQWRLRRKGWKAYCVPAAHVMHIGGFSASQARPASVVNLWRSRLTLFDKHYPPSKRAMARRLIIAGMRRRIHQLSSQDADMVAACREVIELARA